MKISVQPLLAGPSQTNCIDGTVAGQAGFLPMPPGHDLNQGFLNQPSKWLTNKYQNRVDSECRTHNRYYSIS